MISFTIKGIHEDFINEENGYILDRRRDTAILSLTR